jgi:hypothetical protein
MPIRRKRPAPRMSGKISFWMPSGKNTISPTARRTRDGPARSRCGEKRGPPISRHRGAHLYFVRGGFPALGIEKDIGFTIQGKCIGFDGPSHYRIKTIEVGSTVTRNPSNFSYAASFRSQRRINT